MNRKAFELALKTAVALRAEIAPFTKWDRKNYYYPDLPKNYQISQYDLPFSRGGMLEIPVRKDGGGGGTCRLTRIHLEEDTGKLTHGDGGFSEVDLNRAGIPLLEIVTEPEIRTPADARGCLEELQADPPLSGRLRLRDAGRLAALRRQRQPPHHEGRPDDRHADRRDQEPEQLPLRREGPDLRGRAAVPEVARGRPDDQGRAQDDARLERRRRSHQAPAREGDGRRLSLFPRARPGSRRRRRSLARPRPRRRSASCPRPGGSGSRRSTASRPTTPTFSSSKGRTSPTISTPSPRRPASTSWRATGSSRTCSGRSRRRS